MPVSSGPFALKNESFLIPKCVKRHIHNTATTSVSTWQYVTATLQAEQIIGKVMDDVRDCLLWTCCCCCCALVTYLHSNIHALVALQRTQFNV